MTICKNKLSTINQFLKLTIKAKPAENNTPSKGTNTGDSNHPVLWISLMSLALIGIGAIVLFRKKRMN